MIGKPLPEVVSQINVLLEGTSLGRRIDICIVDQWKAVRTDTLV
jgi:hypothetical protein